MMNTHVHDPALDVERCLNEALEACEARGLFSMQGSKPAVRRLTSGTGSLALFYVHSEPAFVIKIGESAVMREETDFFHAAKDFTRDAQLIDFPEVYLRSIERHVGWFVMEAGNDATIEQDLYDGQGRLIDGWSNALSQFGDNIAPVYHNTLTQEVWKLDRYHLTDRTRSLLTQNEELRFNAARISEMPALDTVVSSKTVINGLEFAPPLEMLERAVSRVAPDDAHSCFIHGDLQLRNVLASRRRSGFLLIDPRASWEGRAPHVAFHGSPIYDAANILHSIAGLSPILIGKENLSSVPVFRSMTSRSSGTTIELEQEFFDSTTAAIDAAEDIVAQMLPWQLRQGNWRARLYLYAANSCFGWLKSSTVVQNVGTWASIYSTGIRLLGRACQ